MDTLTTRTEAVITDKKKAGSQALINWGYGFLILSLALYAIEELTDIERLRENFAVFFVHYLIAVAYTIVLIFHGSLGIIRSFRREHISKTVVLLNLFLISAYALNREIPVFNESVAWFCVCLILSSVVVLSFRFFSMLPESVNKLQYVGIGSALVLYLYLAVYCANYYIFGGIGIIALGIGAHVLVPLFILVATGVLIHHSRQKKRISYGWIVSGAGIIVVFSAGFVVQWNSSISKIEKSANQSVLYPDTELPAWVRIAQTVENNWITERILKYDLGYTVANNHFQWDPFPSRARWTEQRKHDPLVFMASITRKAPLSEEERIRILMALTDNRHKAEERLWSGDNLVTSYIVTDADIYPDLRIAYTEKYFNIRNTLPAAQTWRRPQEAIYTFQLPEGSVVTSLSLWVNGKEEKAILTSKQKANNAYKTIVGVERRDPSIVHWQEGNTVSVRVFPCTPTEERRFKIGITSPLSEENGRIFYKGIAFRGPNAHDASEAFRVRFIGDAPGLSLPGSLQLNEKGEFVSEQTFDGDFALSFKSIPLRPNQFTFDGFTYSLSDLEPVMAPTHFSALYLDINSAWSEDELSALQPLAANHTLYAFADDQFIALTDDNWDKVTSSLVAHNFSVFPFHRIKDRESSLVVTKGRELSPFLADFKDSNFAARVGEFFTTGRKPYVYNISPSISTYIRSLRELRALQFSSGSTEQLLAFLHNEQYPVTAENDGQVAIHDARLVITKKPSPKDPGGDNAPDHLARLFAYNDIMRQVGPHFFAGDFVNQKLVDEAVKAYVVSPVSSLIVLETKEDYERFGIQDQANSLLNASKQSSGAVPEPHEWALIILFAFVVIFCLHKQRNTKTIASR